MVKVLNFAIDDGSQLFHATDMTRGEVFEDGAVVAVRNGQRAQPFRQIDRVVGAVPVRERLVDADDALADLFQELHQCFAQFAVRYALVFLPLFLLDWFRVLGTDGAKEGRKTHYLRK